MRPYQRLRTKLKREDFADLSLGEESRKNEREKDKGLDHDGTPSTGNEEAAGTEGSCFLKWLLEIFCCLFGCLMMDQPDGGHATIYDNKRQKRVTFDDKIIEIQDEHVTDRTEVKETDNKRTISKFNQFLQNFLLALGNGCNILCCCCLKKLNHWLLHPNLTQESFSYPDVSESVFSNPTFVEIDMEPDTQDPFRYSYPKFTQLTLSRAEDEKTMTNILQLYLIHKKEEARQLRWPIHHSVIEVGLTGIGIPTDPDGLEEFIKEIEKRRNIKFDIDELLRHNRQLHGKVLFNPEVPYPKCYSLSYLN